MARWNTILLNPVTGLITEAANTTAIVNGTNSQVLNIYNTYTDASNNEVLQVGWLNSTNAYIATKAAGSGTARTLNVGTQGSANMTLITGNTIRWIVDTSGNMTPNADNSQAFGDSTHRATTLHAKSLTIGQSIANPVMGIVTLSGGTGTASVQTTALASGDRIFLTHQNASGTTGTARVTSSTAGTGFTIVSSSSTDTSTIGWFIVKAS